MTNLRTLTTKELDLDALRRGLREVAAQLREQKEEIRATPLPWDRNLWAELRRSKAWATLLCAIRAHARGRLHMRTCTRSHAHLGLPQIERFTLERQARFIGDRWLEFARAAAPPEPVQPEAPLEQEPVRTKAPGAAVWPRDEAAKGGMR